MQCDLFSERLLDALYGELGADLRREVDEHRSTCAACRAEWDGLQQTRQDLQAWKEPSYRPSPSRLPIRVNPWFRVAAAAALVIASGLALRLSGVNIQKTANGTELSFGSSTELIAVQRLLNASESRSQARIEALEAELQAVREARPASAGLGDEDLRRLVLERIRESETRQVERLERLLAAHDEQAEARRRLDMARVAAGLSYLDGKAGQNMARTTQLVGYMLEASQRNGER